MLSTRTRSGALPHTRAYTAAEEVCPDSQAWQNATSTERNHLLELKQALLDIPASDPQADYLHSWARRVGSLSLHDVPGGLHAPDTGLTAEALALHPFSEFCVPPITSPVPMPAPQVAPADFQPRGPRDLLYPWALQAIEDWMQAQLVDLHAYAASGGTAPRTHNKVLALSQSAFLPPARGIIWDLRGDVPTPLDFAAPINTHLNLDRILGELHDFPDKALLSYLKHGVQFHLDVDLSITLIPHLTSYATGLESIERELSELVKDGYYDLFDKLPFLPIRMNAEGSTPRKHEPARVRRIIDGGAPRQPVFDNDDRLVVSLNDAAKGATSCHKDEHTARLEADTVPGCSPAPQLEYNPPTMPERSHHWPPEKKPRVADLCNDAAIIKHLADQLGEPCFMFLDDFRSYFWQMRLHPSVLWLTTFLSRSPDTDQWAVIVENVLAMGLYMSSNVAQRNSHAILYTFRKHMDAMEDAFEESDPRVLEWKAKRSTLHSAHVGEDTASQVAYEEKRRSLLQQHTGRFLTEAEIRSRLGTRWRNGRLWACHCYTDDPVIICCGVQRTIRALRLWHKITAGGNWLMAIEEKRQLGCSALVLGAQLHLSAGLVVIPPDKILRAIHGLTRLRRLQLQFHELASLLGLLEHMTVLTGAKRDRMYAMYLPLRQAHGPTDKVPRHPMLLAQATRWLTLLRSNMGCHFSSVATPLTKIAHPVPLGTQQFHLHSDAAKEGAPVPGLGGFMHGFWWNYPLTEALLLVDIPQLEFMAGAVNIIVFHHYFLDQLQEASPEADIVVHVDSMASAQALTAASSASPTMMHIHQRLMDTAAFQSIQSRLWVGHEWGPANIASDAVSRGLSHTLHRLCAQLHITAVQLDLPEVALEFIHDVVSFFHELHRLTHGASGFPAPDAGEPPLPPLPAGPAATSPLSTADPSEGPHQDYAGEHSLQGDGPFGDTPSLQQPLRSVATSLLSSSPPSDAPHQDYLGEHSLQGDGPTVDTLACGGVTAARAFFWQSPLTSSDLACLASTCPPALSSATPSDCPHQDYLGEHSRQGDGPKGTKRSRQDEVVAELSAITQRFRGVLQVDDMIYGQGSVPSIAHIAECLCLCHPVLPSESIDLVLAMSHAQRRHVEHQANMAQQLVEHLRHTTRRYHDVTGATPRAETRQYAATVYSEIQAFRQCFPLSAAEASEFLPYLTPGSRDRLPHYAASARLWVHNLRARAHLRHTWLRAFPAANRDDLSNLQRTYNEVITEPWPPTGQPESEVIDMAMMVYNKPRDWAVRFVARLNWRDRRIIGSGQRLLPGMAELIMQHPLPLSLTDPLELNDPAEAPHQDYAGEHSRQGDGPGLPPTAPPRINRPSIHTAHIGPAPRVDRTALIRLLADDTSAAAVRPTDWAQVEKWCDLNAAYHAAAFNSRTMAVDSGGWRKYWVPFCRRLNTPAFRRDPTAAQPGNKYFVREVALFTWFLLYVWEHIRPRRRSDKQAKPSSIYNVLQQVRRTHKRHNLGHCLPPVSAVINTIKGMTKWFVSVHGAEALLPHRKEPLPMDVISAILRLTTNEMMVAMRCNCEHAAMAFQAFLALLCISGFRKGDICPPPHERHGPQHASWASVVWMVEGMPEITCPSAAQTRLLLSTERTTYMAITSSVMKNDPDSTRFGSNYIYTRLVQHDATNTAWKMLLLEAKQSFPSRAARHGTPLFGPSWGESFSHSALDTYHLRVLQQVSARYPEVLPRHTIIRYSLHSYRISLAVRLVALTRPDGSRAVDNDTVKHMCRWLSDESLKVYARIGAEQYASLLERAAQVRVDTVQAKTLWEQVPYLDEDHKFQFMKELASTMREDTDTSQGDEEKVSASGPQQRD